MYEEGFFEKHLLYPLMCVVFIIIPLGFGMIIYDCTKAKRLQDSMLQIADINKDGITSREELARVYQELRVQFNESNVSSRDLLRSQLEEYLQNHEE